MLIWELDKAGLNADKDKKKDKPVEVSSPGEKAAKAKRALKRKSIWSIVKMTSEKNDGLNWD